MSSYFLFLTWCCAFIKGMEYRFVPYPHIISQSDSEYESVSGSFITGPFDQSYYKLSRLEQSARRDGYFVNPVKPVRILSQADVIECLNDRKIRIAGDSYTMNLFIGLTDLLLGNQSTYSYPSHHLRVGYIKIVKSLMARTPYLQKIDVDYVCSAHHECYGDATNLEACRYCLHHVGKTDATVVGTTIHLLKYKHAKVESVYQAITDFIKLTPNIIWTS